MTSSELLQYYGHTWPREKNEVHHNRIQTAVKNIISMMDDVLIIGKSDAGKLISEKKLEHPVDVTIGILDEIELNSKGSHKIVFDSPQIETTIWLDRKLYRQILSNLVTNALKYSSKGSTVHVDLKFDEKQLLLTVKDQGIGIPKSDVDQMFQAFFRAKNVGETPGTGLGLPIVKRSVDTHGGTISIDSTENVGTTITVILDVSKSVN